MSKYQPGQVWKYHTLLGNDESRLTIIAVDPTEKDGVVIGVSIDGLNIPSPDGSPNAVGKVTHFPFTQAALDKSVTELVGSGGPVAPGEGHEEWRKEYAAGRAGVFTITVKEVLSLMFGEFIRI